MTRTIDPSLRMLSYQMPGLRSCKDEDSVFICANSAHAQAFGVVRQNLHAFCR